ncbi:MAG TPA: AbrB/MazE/SpoVT family DNA-binding domain-containing protein [Alphaproteobacteria bacterium]|nr:AbrB/MazE/SpoVT family DNA-binding domain-containing protein [Alphaproteobacteria bacterium]
MSLVRVKHKGQVTIPAEIREEFALAEGDYLEVSREGGKIVLQPKIVLDRDIATKIAEGLADLQAGRVTPAFDSVVDLIKHISPAGSPDENSDR